MRYRMAPEELVFWMGPIEGDVDPRYGVLCRRHADSLTVPRGWTLDDSRDPTLRLFRPPTVPHERPRRAPSDRPAQPPKVVGEQLALDDPPSVTTPPPTGGVPTAGDRPSERTGNDTGDEAAVDGLARPPISPLLARAFRGTPLGR